MVVTSVILELRATVDAGNRIYATLHSRKNKIFRSVRVLFFLECYRSVSVRSVTGNGLMGFLGVGVDDSWLFLEESAKMWGNLRVHSWEMNNTDSMQYRKSKRVSSMVDKWIFDFKCNNEIENDYPYRVRDNICIEEKKNKIKVRYVKNNLFHLFIFFTLPALNCVNNLDIDRRRLMIVWKWDVGFGREIRVLEESDLNKTVNAAKSNRFPIRYMDFLL